MKKHKEAVTEKTNTTHINNTAILGDCKTLRSGRAKFKHFPGALSRDLLHYVDPTLEEHHFEAAIFRIGVNNIQYDSSSQQINLLLQNIKETGKKCKSN